MGSEVPAKKSSEAFIGFRVMNILRCTYRLIPTPQNLQAQVSWEFD